MKTRTLSHKTIIPDHSIMVGKRLPRYSPGSYRCYPIKYDCDFQRTASAVDPSLKNEIRALKLRLLDVQEKFTGDPTRTRRNEDAVPGLQSRLSTAMFGAMGSTTGPTGTHRRQFEIAGEQYQAVVGELRQLIETDLPALFERLDRSGAPWTPGRKLPDWQKK